MHLLDLPDEILQLCCPTTDLAGLRLTCRRFAIISLKPLFSHVHLLPNTRSAKKLQSILNNESLAPLVNGITVQASLLGPGWQDVDDPIPVWNLDLVADNERQNDHVSPGIEYGIEDEGNCENFSTEFGLEHEVSAVFKRTISGIGRLPNLRRLELRYDDDVNEPVSSSRSTLS